MPEQRALPMQQGPRPPRQPQPNIPQRPNPPRTPTRSDHITEPPVTPWAANLDPSDQPTPPPSASPYITGANMAIDPNNSEANFRPHDTGRFAAQDRGPTTGQHQIGQFTTGGFLPVEQLSGQFSVDQLAAGAPGDPQNPSQLSMQQYAGWITAGEITTDTRFRFGVWGASVGTILGILLGMMNAFFEGVSLANAQVSLILITLFFMLSLGATAAFIPREVERLMRDLKIIRE